MTDPDTTHRASSPRPEGAPSNSPVGRAPGLSRAIELLLLLYALGLVALFLAGMRSVANPGFPLGGPEDYTIFYTAGRILGQGQNARLYDLSLQSQVQQAVLQPYGLAAQGSLLPYNYPPFFAAFFVLLSHLPLPASFATWYVLNLGFVLLGVGLLARTREPRSAAGRLLALLLALSFLPVLLALAKGQSSLLLLLLLALFYLALRQHRDGLAGLVLALAMIKPQLALPFLLALVLMRRWRALLAFGIVAAGLLLVSWLLVGTEGLLSYGDMLRYSAAWDGGPGFYPEVMPNLRGTVVRLAASLDARSALRLPVPVLAAIVAVLTLGSLLALARLWRRPIPTPSSRFDLAFAATLALALLISPHLYDHDLALLVIAGFLLITPRLGPARPATGIGWVAAGHMVPWLGFFLLAAAWQAQLLALLLVVLAALPFLLRSQGSRGCPLSSLAYLDQDAIE